MYVQYIVGNKAKGLISKRVFQENKATQIIRKTNISYPLIRTGGRKTTNSRNIPLQTIYSPKPKT